MFDEVQRRVKISNEKLIIKIQVELSEMKKTLKFKTQYMWIKWIKHG